MHKKSKIKVKEKKLSKNQNIKAATTGFIVGFGIFRRKINSAKITTPTRTFGGSNISSNNTIMCYPKTISLR